MTAREPELTALQQQLDLGAVVGVTVPVEPLPPLPDPTQDVEAWLRYGIARGFCTRDECLVHEGFPMTQAEQAAELEDGEPPCFHGVRLISDPDRAELAPKARA